MIIKQLITKFKRITQLLRTITTYNKKLEQLIVLKELIYLLFQQTETLINKFLVIIYLLSQKNIILLYKNLIIFANNNINNNNN